MHALFTDSPQRYSDADAIIDSADDVVARINPLQYVQHEGPPETGLVHGFPGRNERKAEGSPPRMARVAAECCAGIQRSRPFHGYPCLDRFSTLIRYDELFPSSCNICRADARIGLETALRPRSNRRAHGAQNAVDQTWSSSPSRRRYIRTIASRILPEPNRLHSVTALVAVRLLFEGSAKHKYRSSRVTRVSWLRIERGVLFETAPGSDGQSPCITPQAALWKPLQALAAINMRYSALLLPLSALGENRRLLLFRCRQCGRHTGIVAQGRSGASGPTS